MHNINYKRQEAQIIFLRETIKLKTPQTSSEIEWAPTAAVKHENINMISDRSCLFLWSQLLLSHSCAPVEWVCFVINRESHSLFILFRSLKFHSNKSAPLNNYLLGPTSLGESNNPSAPQLVGTLPLQSTMRVNLNTMVGTIALTYNNSPRVDFSRIV